MKVYAKLSASFIILLTSDTSLSVYPKKTLKLSELNSVNFPFKSTNLLWSIFIL